VFGVALVECVPNAEGDRMCAFKHLLRFDVGRIAALMLSCLFGDRWTIGFNLIFTGIALRTDWEDEGGGCRLQ